MSKKFEPSSPASGAATSEHSEPESPPNNIDSGKYHTEENPWDDFLPLRWGIDSLYLSFHGEMKQEARQRLAGLKAQAQNAHLEHLAQAQADGHIFTVSDKGRRMYRYLLLGACLEIQLCDTSSPTIPVAYVKVLSQYLTSVSPQKAVQSIRSILSHFCVLEGDEKVSRADLFLDFCYPDEEMLALQAKQFVTRAEVIRPYFTDQVLTGWDFGLGSVLSARLYNKTLQIEASGQRYLLWLWQLAGWNHNAKVWRLEYQLRRPILDGFNVQTVTDLTRYRGELWSYLTQEWLRLTIPDRSDTNRSRWLTHPLWIAIWDGGCGSLDMPMRKRVRTDNAPETETLMRTLCGVLSSLFAVHNITTLKDGMAWLAAHLPRLLQENFSGSGLRLDHYLVEQVKKKVRLFNLGLNDDSLNNPGNFYK